MGAGPYIPLLVSAVLVIWFRIYQGNLTRKVEEWVRKREEQSRQELAPAVPEQHSAEPARSQNVRAIADVAVETAVQANFAAAMITTFFSAIPLLIDGSPHVGLLVVMSLIFLILLFILMWTLQQPAGTLADSNGWLMTNISERSRLRRFRNIKNTTLLDYTVILVNAALALAILVGR